MSKKHGKRTGSKRSRMPKDGAVWRQSGEEATLARKPYYNAFACGHGAHGDTKYNRAKEKRTWKRDLQKGASRGSFLMTAHIWQGQKRGSLRFLRTTVMPVHAICVSLACRNAPCRSFTFS